LITADAFVFVGFGGHSTRLHKKLPKNIQLLRNFDNLLNFSATTQGIAIQQT
jgi:hypothetical protein